MVYSQLELDHTVALHLRSRRVGSDEAVYQVIALFSSLLARLAQYDPATDPQLRSAHRLAAIERHIDTAVAVLRASSIGLLVSLRPASRCAAAQVPRGYELQRSSAKSLIWLYK